MSIYTITSDLLENLDEEGGIYFTDILLVFTQRTNPFKVAIDINGEIIKLYSSIPQNKEIIKTWLDLMSFNPQPFEKINIDVSQIDCRETKFIKLCKETKGCNKILYYSKQNINKFECCDSNIIYEGVCLKVLDRDEARASFIVRPSIQIENSVVAMENSSITKAKINSK